VKSNNKKAFTLIEVLISITLFTIIILFLYQALDITQKSNNFYSEKLEIKQNENDLKKMFFLDFINKIDNKITLESDKNKNTIIKFKSINIYHNPFYTYITYLVSRESNLIRIESKSEFKSKNLSDDFFDSSYIDIIYNNINKFKIEKKDNNIYIYIENKEKDRIYFSI